MGHRPDDPFDEASKQSACLLVARVYDDPPPCVGATPYGVPIVSSSIDLSPVISQ